ncbi:MAG: ABC transporter permease [Promethearchaeota archaeon]
MLQKLNRIINKTLGVTEKELKLKLRYPLSFFSYIFIKPFLSLIPFLILYAGLFGLQTPDLSTILYLTTTKEHDLFFHYQLFKFIEKTFTSSLNQANYFSWLIIGNILFVFSRNGFDAFLEKFSYEKYWNTIQGTLLAPINRYLMLIGYTIVTLIESFLFFLMIIIICVFFIEISIFQIIAIFLIASLMIVAAGGIGLMKGSVFISNENYRIFFEMGQFFILFFSCYSIPFEYFPDFLQGIIQINPFYHGVNLARNLFYGTYSSDIFLSLIYIILFAIITSILGVYLFNKIWKKFGIHGY